MTSVTVSYTADVTLLPLFAFYRCSVQRRREAYDGSVATVLAIRREVRRVPEADYQVDDQLVGLMNQYERPIYNFLLALLRDPDVALDCAQDTFLRAYENLRKGRPVNSSWLYTVARNRAMDEFRGKRRVQPDIDTLEQLPVHEPTEHNLAIQSVLAELSPSDREVLYLFDVAGFKTDEIGAMLGVRGTAIRQRLSRARERFRVLYRAES
jgi:RNA polymerase sigma-70 factor (ECF subfamily)